MTNVATQFKPGNNANPLGRPKKEWTMTSLYIEALNEETETGVPKKILVAKKLVEKALKGDTLAIKELNNRIDGMPVQPMKHEGEIEIDHILHIFKPEKLTG